MHFSAIAEVNEITAIADRSATTSARNVAYFFLCAFPDRDRLAAAVRGNEASICRVVLNVLRHNGPPRDSIHRCKLRAAKTNSIGPGMFSLAKMSAGPAQITRRKNLAFLNDDDRLRLLFGQPSPATL